MPKNNSLTPQSFLLFFYRLWVFLALTQANKNNESQNNITNSAIHVPNQSLLHWNENPTIGPMAKIPDEYQKLEHTTHQQPLTEEPKTSLPPSIQSTEEQTISSFLADKTQILISVYMVPIVVLTAATINFLRHFSLLKKQINKCFNRQKTDEVVVNKKVNGFTLIIAQNTKFLTIVTNIPQRGIELKHDKKKPLEPMPLARSFTLPIAPIPKKLRAFLSSKKDIPINNNKKQLDWMQQTVQQCDKLYMSLNNLNAPQAAPITTNSPWHDKKGTLGGQITNVKEQLRKSDSNIKDYLKITLAKKEEYLKKIKQIQNDESRLTDRYKILWQEWQDSESTRFTNEQTALDQQETIWNTHLNTWSKSLTSCSDKLDLIEENDVSTLQTLEKTIEELLHTIECTVENFNKAKQEFLDHYERNIKTLNNKFNYHHLAPLGLSNVLQQPQQLQQPTFLNQNNNNKDDKIARETHQSAVTSYQHLIKDETKDKQYVLHLALCYRLVLFLKAESNMMQMASSTKHNSITLNFHRNILSHYTRLGMIDEEAQMQWIQDIANNPTQKITHSNSSACYKPHTLNANVIYKNFVTHLGYYQSIIKDSELNQEIKNDACAMLICWIAEGVKWFEYNEKTTKGNNDTITIATMQIADTASMRPNLLNPDIEAYKQDRQNICNIFNSQLCEEAITISQKQSQSTSIQMLKPPPSKWSQEQFLSFSFK
jgi:hypothetical protein